MSKILILCTGNSCRSQMAEAFLLSFDPCLEVFSAGTNPASSLHPKTIEVMKELEMDLSRNTPKHIENFINEDFDYVITVCDDAKETCPYFSGKVKKRLHIGFEDPAETQGTDEKITEKFREIRDQIQKEFKKFYMENFTK